MTEAERQSWLAAFVQGLRQLGWTEGQKLRMDIRWNTADAGLARTYAEELIGLMPDVILAASTVNLTAIRQATSTVPVVFVWSPTQSRRDSLTAYDTRVATLPVSLLSRVQSGDGEVSVCLRARAPRAPCATVSFTEMPLGDIALAVSFSSQSHLTETFRRSFGVTPGRIRRER